MPSDADIERPDAAAAPDALAPLAPDVAEAVVCSTTMLPSPEPDPTSVVFAMTRMHEIDIVIDAKDVPAINKKLDQRIPIKFTFDGIVVNNVGAKQKGGSYQAVRSLRGKPSLSLKFDEFVPEQTLSGLKKLILNHGAQGRAFLGEHLGYEMYRRAKIPGPRTSFATVTINGFTEGIYIVKEAVGAQFLARHYGKKCDQGNLYEANGSDFADSPKALELKDEAEEGRKRDDLMAAANLVKTAPDATFEAQISGKINLDNFITTYAIDAVILHLDDAAYHSNNFYMYDHPADGRFVFLPHGMDQTFTGFLHVVKEDISPFALPPASIPRDIFGGARLSRRLRAIPALDARFRAEVARVARDVWNQEALLARIDEAAAVIRMTTNKENSQTAADRTRFEANLPPLRQFIMTRPGHLK